MTFRVRIAVLVAVAACLAVVTAVRLDVSYDLAAFLPEATTAEQRILKERFGQGPGAQVIYAVLPDASAEAAAAVAARLRDNPLVRRVLHETPALGLADLPAVLTQSQFLLADLPQDEAGWRDVLQARLADTMLADDDVIAMISADPLLAATNALQGAAETAPRFELAGDRYLLIFGAAPAFDGGAQGRLVEAIRADAANAGIAVVALYGPGVYTADLQKAVRREATWFSLLAGCGLVGLLLWRFRSIAVVAAISVPMLVGAAAGALAVSLFFGQVHGIAIAFGFTLLGVAVDYPLHTFSHVAHPRGVWPTLRIGVATTAIAYSVFLLGGSPGLAQLGLFAVVGVASAALATAWMRTNQAAPPYGHAEDISQAARLRNWPWAVAATLAVPLLVLRPPFTDDLGALTPVPPDVLAADAEIRERLGASDMRHLVAVQHADLEVALQSTEAVARILDDAQQAGALRGHQHVARLLPSLATQQRRQDALDRFVAAGATSSGPFADAARGIGYTAEAFEPFDARAAAAVAAPHTLTRDRLRADADLASFVDTHLFEAEAEGTWKSLVFLRGIADHGALARQLNGEANVEVLDLKRASTSLVGDFRARLLTVLGFALAALAALLWLLTRNARRTVWIFGTVVAAIALAATATAALRGAVTPFDLMALALVAGLVLDYSLFSSKSAESPEDGADTRRAVAICAASSLLVFGLVSFSTVPVLGGIGTTVAVGVIAGYLLARLGRPAAD